MTTVSLIISTYNWNSALEVILKSVSEQSQLPDEVIIADDGTKDEAGVKLIIESYQAKLQNSIVWVRQEDKGNRKAKILNKAIAKAQNPYIIQIDGDIILHSQFIEDHLKKVKKGLYLFGSRANIKQPFVQEVIQEKKTHFNYFSKEIKKKSRVIYSTFLSQFTKPSADFSQKFRGCNVSYWKEDAIAINGYNEDFEGWGREDSDFAIRLLNHGILGRRLKFCAIVYHLSHAEQSKSNLKKNNEIQLKTIENKTTWVENGISQYL